VAAGLRDGKARTAMSGEWIYGRRVVRLALAAGARRRPLELAGTAAALASLGLGERPGRLTPDVVDARELERLTGSRDHQGVAVMVPAYPYAAAADLLAADLVVALDEVSDPRNLGAVARTALACGAGGLVILRNRSAAITPAAVKASAGATEHLAIAQVTNLTAFLREAKQVGFWVYGAAGDSPVSYLDLDLRVKVVLALGSEGRGLRRLVAETCDELAALPMGGPVESLNVSVAAAVFLYEVRRQRSSAPATGPTASDAGRVSVDRRSGMKPS
jgi:23S rRNA (guanosine2251-2'-O)-methyltransferase